MGPILTPQSLPRPLSRVERLVSYVMPGAAHLDADALRRVHLLLGLAVLMAVVCPVFAVINFLIYELPVLAMVLLVGAAASSTSLLVLRHARSLALASNILLSVAAGSIVLAVASLEGLTSPALSWLVVLPLLASSIGGRWVGVGWTLISIAIICTLVAADAVGLLPNEELPASTRRITAAWNHALLMLAALTFPLLYDTAQRRSSVLLARLRMELEVAREQAAFAERMAALGRLVAGVAHEINNPISFVSSNLRYVHGVLTDVEKGQALVSDVAEGIVAATDALTGTSRIEQIVRDLQTLGRGGGDRVITIEPMHALEVSLRIVAHELNHRVTLVRELGPVAPVKANESRLGQVLVNLLTNACDAMPPTRSAADSRVRVATFMNPVGEVCLEVSDNGLGMNAEVRRRIFDPFFTTKPVGAGTGLGLAICQRLVGDMGGRIEVESTEGEGTTFRLVLPAAGPVEVSAARNVVERPTRRRRVLVIDDEVLVCKSIERLLGRTHDILHANEAQGVLSRDDLGSFDAILCDVVMPGCTGPQFLAQLRKSHPTLANRVGFITGSAPRFAEQGPLAPAAPTVAKPFTRESLQELIDVLVAQP